jgi:acetyl-CoA carboxylase biotin carboxyl carrier protein
MDLEFIAGLVALVARSRVRVLDYEAGGARVHIVAGDDGVPVARTTTTAAAADDRPTADDPQAVADGSDAGAGRAHEIRAGMAAVFYRAAEPGTPPYVSEGDAVEDGQVLGILEAMKSFNPIEADRAGRVARIAVADGATVAAGDVLFVLEPTP